MMDIWGERQAGGQAEERGEDRDEGVASASWSRLPSARSIGDKTDNRSKASASISAILHERTTMLPSWLTLAGKRLFCGHGRAIKQAME